MFNIIYSYHRRNYAYVLALILFITRLNCDAREHETITYTTNKLPAINLYIFWPCRAIHLTVLLQSVSNLFHGPTIEWYSELNSWLVHCRIALGKWNSEAVMHDFRQKMLSVQLRFLWNSEFAPAVLRQKYLCCCESLILLVAILSTIPIYKNINQTINKLLVNSDKYTDNEPDMHFFKLYFIGKN